jgi:RNA polymerase sigma-70 factor (ECF subfamily)
MPVGLRKAFEEHRPALLRHCYRMVGSYADAEDLVQESFVRAWKNRASYRGDAPLQHWLHSIATRACLNALKSRRRRGLPQHDFDPAEPGTPLDTPLAEAEWLTPFPSDRKEEIALAFISLLQRLSPKPRAVLLLKDVAGLSAAEIASALQLSLPAVNSALHRARSALRGAPSEPPDDPPASVVRAYVRAWESRDLDALVALLRKDVVFAMPPWRIWFRGREPVRKFILWLRSTSLAFGALRLRPVRANGQAAFLVEGRRGRRWVPHSLQLVAFERGLAKEVTTFVGEAFLAGFEQFRGRRLS